MFETAQKYSEITYYSKEAIAKELNYYMVEPVWNEVYKYREMFRINFPMQDKNSYLIRNPLVNDTMMRLQEELLIYLRNHQEEPLKAMDTFWLANEEKSIFHCFLTQLQLGSYAHDTKQLFYHCIETFHLQERIQPHVFQSLLQHQHNILFQLFIISMEKDKKISFVLQYPIYCMHSSLALANLINIEEVYDIYDKNTKDLDVTPHFLSFLAYLRLKLSNRMVLLDGNVAIDIKTLACKELSERFPRLKKEQITFYCEHRSSNHYYTIADYMKEAHVCYETARYSLEQLVDEHWYQKQKMGKKFVYFVL